MTSIGTLYRWIYHSWYGLVGTVWVDKDWCIVKKGLTVIVFLRCSSNKVYLMSASSLINISYGDRCEAQKVEEKSTGKSQQAGRSGSTPPTRAPFSPSLGASPELSGKNNNRHNSPEVRLNSSGASARFNSGFFLEKTFSPLCIYTITGYNPSSLCAMFCFPSGAPPPGFGRGMSPNSPYGGGFGLSNGMNSLASPCQANTRTNTPHSKTKQRTPVIQARGSPQAQINNNRSTQK